MIIIADYRQNYYRNRKRKSERCVYCWKKLKPKDITIDHIIPQNFYRKLKWFSKYIFILLYFLFGYLMMTVEGQLILEKLHLNTIHIVYASYIIYTMLFILNLFFKHFLHSKANLAPACRQCNSSKRDKLDYRVVKGFIMLLLRLTITKIILVLLIIYLLLNFINL